MSNKHKLICTDCSKWLSSEELAVPEFNVSFLDPPFNQGKNYRSHDDQMNDDQYWEWMLNISEGIFKHSATGAAIYFMQREKNSERVLETLRKSGWTFQNLIIWKKKTSIVPGIHRYGKAYQIIVYATKGSPPSVFNRLRINPPLPQGYTPRTKGVCVNDVWDDIRELTSGYFAGDEALRTHSGERAHKQQSPIALLLRIILTSSLPGDCIFDPFAGTGTTLSVACQLDRYAIGIEKDPLNFELIENRLNSFRKSDHIDRYQSDYFYTDNLERIWPSNTFEYAPVSVPDKLQPTLFN